MKTFLLLLCCAQVDVPVEMRTSNYDGGSCVHASTVTSLRMQGRPNTADWWRANFSYGEYCDRHVRRLEKAGIRYAYTVGRDNVAFLEWCIRTRRVPGIAVDGGVHFINLVGLDARYARTIDNNTPNVVDKWQRDVFIDHWKDSGSWAVVPVYSPLPPKE